MRRPVVIGAALGLGLVGAGAASSLIGSLPPAQSSATPGFSARVESTALYCTGLGTGVGAGHVVFTNLTGTPRELSVQVVADSGQSESRGVALGPHASTSVVPQNWVADGHYYGVSAIVSGGGVVGAEVTTSATGVAPCSAQGEVSWVAAGFSTQVGSSALISLLNPSATPAVVNLTTMSANGFAAPAPFQGLAVGPHAEVTVDLGKQVVDTDNVGVRLNVVHGAVVALGVQSGPGGTSFDVGQAAASSHADFPAVSTASGAIAQVRIANPNDAVAQLSVSVSVPGDQIAPLSLQVRGFSTGVVSITPNTAIPPAGFAVVHVSANEPVVTGLALGAGTSLGLSAPSALARQWLLSDFSGRGFAKVFLGAPAGPAVHVTVTDLLSARSARASLSGASVRDLRSLVSGFSSLRGASVLVTSDRPISLTSLLPVGKVEPVVASALYGR